MPRVSKEKDSDKKTISFRVDKKECEQLDKLAATMRRDRSFLLNEALHSYIVLQQYQIERIIKAKAQADAGNFASDEEVEAMFKDL